MLMMLGKCQQNTQLLSVFMLKDTHSAIAVNVFQRLALAESCAIKINQSEG